METNQVQEVPVHYNSNQLVTYKVIDGESVTYPTAKVTDIEYSLYKARLSSDEKNKLQSTINKIIDNLTEQYWYDSDTDKDTVLSELCEILNFNPMKTIEFSATLDITGSIDIPLNEAEGFDLESHLMESISVDSYRGDMELDWELRSAYEN